MKKNNRGIALFITLMLLFLLSLVVIAVLLTAYNYNYICEKQIKRAKAIVSLEAGISYAYYRLRTDAPVFSAQLVEPTYTIIPEGNGFTVKIWVWQTGATPGKYTVKVKTTY